MNIPYKKEVNSEGQVTNFPVEGVYKNVYPNRKQRRNMVKPGKLILNNKKGIQIITTKTGPTTVVAYKILYQKIATGINKLGKIVAKRVVVHYVPMKPFKVSKFNSKPNA